MNTISFMSANYVARQLNYHMTRGWGQGETATNNYFMPLETFPQRFEDLLVLVRELAAQRRKLLAIALLGVPRFQRIVVIHRIED